MHCFSPAYLEMYFGWHVSRIARHLHAPCTDASCMHHVMFAVQWVAACLARDQDIGYRQAKLSILGTHDSAHQIENLSRHREKD